MTAAVDIPSDIVEFIGEFVINEQTILNWYKSLTNKIYTNIDGRNIYGILDTAIKNKHKDIVIYLLDNYEIILVYAITIAAGMGSFNIVDYILRKDKLKAEDLGPAYYHAAKKGYIRIVKMFHCYTGDDNFLHTIILDKSIPEVIIEYVSQFNSMG
jgi:hypothetical protein